MKYFASLLCLYLTQICSGQFNIPRRDPQAIRTELSKIKGISDHFAGDINAILDEYQSNDLVNIILYESIDSLVTISKWGNETIDVDSIKDHSKKMPEYKYTDNVKIFQTLLLKKLPAERCNGLINMIYAMRPSAKENEIQSALDYLYGIETSAPFINIPDITSMDCSNDKTEVLLSETIDKLKSMDDINLKIIEDLSAIVDKFPCNEFVMYFLGGFMHGVIRFNAQFHGDTSKIDFCKIMAERAKMRQSYDEERVSWSKIMRTVLSTRLPEDDYNGIVNFMELVREDATVDDIQHAVEYLYGIQYNEENLPTC